MHSFTYFKFCESKAKCSINLKGQHHFYFLIFMYDFNRNQRLFNFDLSVVGCPATSIKSNQINGKLVGTLNCILSGAFVFLSRSILQATITEFEYLFSVGSCWPKVNIWPVKSRNWCVGTRHFLIEIKCLEDRVYSTIRVVHFYLSKLYALEVFFRHRKYLSLQKCIVI